MVYIVNKWTDNHNIVTWWQYVNLNFISISIYCSTAVTSLGASRYACYCTDGVLLSFPSQISLEQHVLICHKLPVALPNDEKDVHNDSDADDDGELSDWENDSNEPWKLWW